MVNVPSSTEAEDRCPQVILANNLLPFINDVNAQQTSRSALQSLCSHNKILEIY